MKKVPDKNINTANSAMQYKNYNIIKVGSTEVS